jgi:uncharacterized membrane protein
MTSPANNAGSWLYWLAAALALAGLADALYLTYQHLTGAHLQCTIVQGCAEVLGSKYAAIGPVPLAALGAGAYFTVFSLAMLGTSGYRVAGQLLPPLVAVMFVTTLGLLYLQAFVIERYCQYCLLSAATTFGLSLVAGFIYKSRRAADFVR